jgi:pimeloyl-ACP methyl ester carboxylesterase
MDVLRRAVGDDKLSYLGFSYGTVLGQYYANMFPDRDLFVATYDDLLCFVERRTHAFS